MINRKRIYEIMEVASPGDNVSRVFDLFILTLISLNIIMLVFETVNSVYRSCMLCFNYFELFSIVIFTSEYVLRIWCCVENPAFRAPLTGRLRYIISFLGLVDLLAILPFYLPFTGVDYRFLRAVRLFRLIRIFKLTRYSIALSSLQHVIVKRKEELISTLMLLLLLLLVASSLMYFAEKDAQPEAFSSIPMTMWWGVATLTTVGYGDIYPVTVIGKMLGAVIAILGIGMFALPAGILGATFLEELEERRNQRDE